MCLQQNLLSSALALKAPLRFRLVLKHPLPNGRLKNSILLSDDCANFYLQRLDPDNPRKNQSPKDSPFSDCSSLASPAFEKISLSQRRIPLFLRGPNEFFKTSAENKKAGC